MINKDPTPEQIKRMKAIAYKIADRRYLLAGVDKETLMKDLVQEGWLAWLINSHKEDKFRFKAAAGAMSDYWRRWKWGIHFRNNIDHDGHIINDNRTRNVQRPPMNHLPLHDLQSALDGDIPSNNIEKQLISYAHIEETVWVKETLDYINNTFISRKNSSSFGQTLYDAILNEGYRASELSGRFIGGSRSKTLSNSARVRCMNEIKQEINKLYEL